MNQARTERVRNEPSTARRREQRLKARLLASFNSRRSPKKTQNHPHDSELTVETLREAGQLNLQDFFTFVFGNATRDLDAAPYGGARFPVDARLAGRTFVKFHLDVSTGDVLRGPYESLSGRDWLRFAGIASANFLAVSLEEQFAEKLHAYTLPRVGRENTRVKDLVDLVLLIERTTLDTARLPKAIRETFQRRKTHDIPSALIPPPASWSGPFSEMAAECSLEPNMEKHFGAVAQFFRRLSS